MMRKMKVIMAGSALAAATLSGPALAETSGTVAITSEYMFRGVVSEGGAAVQGSLDWSDPSGFYLGAWASNANPSNPLSGGGGNELDLYGGYTFTITEGVEGDVGAVWYIFSEDEEASVTPGFFVLTTNTETDLDYWEVYGGVTFGGFGAKLYYADNYFNMEDHALGSFGQGYDPTVATDGEAIYVTLNYDWVIKEGLDLNFQVGHSTGDGVERFLRGVFGDASDDYTDWSITLTKALDNGFSASFAYVQTDIDPVSHAGAPAAFGTAGFFTGFDDDPKFVVTLAKGFEI